VRTAVGVVLVTVCLGLTGCSLFGKKRTAQNDNPKPFLGTETPAKAATAAMPRETGGPLPGANGVLAGRVIVEATGRPVRASILIKNRDREEAKAADLDISTDDSGFFTITKLNVGDHYELVARTNDNGDLISRTVWATPPQPTLLIRLDKRFTTTSTPPPPNMPPSVPDKKGAPNPSKESTEGKPAVSIDPPVKFSEQEPQPRRGNAGPSPGSGSDSGNSASPDPANIASGEFPRVKPPSVPVDIPGSTPSIPPVPGSQQWQSVPEQDQPKRSAPAVQGSSGSVLLPNIPTPVPSCGLYGNKLENFALYDLDGKPWEYKRDRRGRLILLDFWRHNCGPCIYCIPALVDLQRDFGTVGLEVVGIACEVGDVKEQCANVRPILNRNGVNYKILLCGGGPEHCPVMRDFGVEYLPYLVLIDESGYIIWRSPRTGMSNEEHVLLRKKIRDYLVTNRQPMP
jgi:thiol-disulfide isomerase/thioredoxin